MSDNPYSAPISSSVDHVSDDPSSSWRSVTEPLRLVAGYNRFLGITLIVIGVLYCLTLFGAVIGWLPIWIGILFLKSGDNMKNGSAAATHEGVTQLAKIIRIMGVAAAVFLAFMLIYFVFVVGLMWAGFSAVKPIPAP